MKKKSTKQPLTVCALVLFTSSVASNYHLLLNITYALSMAEYLSTKDWVARRQAISLAKAHRYPKPFYDLWLEYLYKWFQNCCFQKRWNGFANFTTDASDIYLIGFRFKAFNSKVMGLQYLDSIYTDEENSLVNENSSAFPLKGMWISICFLLLKSVYAGFVYSTQKSI